MPDKEGRSISPFVRPCCGASVDDFDRDAGSAWLPHKRSCRYWQDPRRVRCVRVSAGHVEIAPATGLPSSDSAFSRLGAWPVTSERQASCPGRLALCGVPCGCAGDNPSHYPPASSASPQSASSAPEQES